MGFKIAFKGLKLLKNSGNGRLNNLNDAVLIVLRQQIEIKSRLKLGNACYHSVQNLLSSSLLSKNSKFKIYRNIILPVAFYRCETWSFTLRKESKLGVFENTVLWRIFGHKKDEVTGEWRKLHNEELNP